MWYRPKKHSVALNEIARLVQGELVGDGARIARSLCSIDALEPEALTFARRRLDPKQVEEVRAARLAGILLPLGELPPSGVSAIAVADPNLAFVRLFEEFFEIVLPKPGIHPKAEVSESARIGRNVSIGAFAVIGDDVVVEDDAVIHPHVVVYPSAFIGRRAILHSGVAIREGARVMERSIIHNGVVIGADGFGYVPDPQRGLRKVPQVGTVEIGPDAEVGANSCIDKAAFGATKVGAGAKLDNLVQIGHNAVVGRSTIICGQTGVAGSAEIGNGVVIGAQSGVAGHLKIADGARIGARSGVIGDVKKKGDYIGFPLTEAGAWRRQVVALSKLPEMIRRRKSEE